MTLFTFELIINCIHIIQFVSDIGYINDSYLKHVKNSFYLSRIFVLTMRL